MKVEQMYTNCLAEAAYYIESNGEVAIIDPLRDPSVYIEKAKADNAKIKYIFETHFHADFVSGHVDLAKKTGAKIIFGPSAQPNYEAHIATDNELMPLGNVMLKVLHTPGHTMESISVLLTDEKGKDYGLFSGDALFIGDVGRPDLAIKSDLTLEDLAGHLFDSLRNKIMPLADDVIVYPNHGAGSACGKNMSDETTDTLGNQKMFNYALRADMTKEEFVAEVTDGLVAPPQYFPKNAMLNKMGTESIDDVLLRANNALELDEFISVIEKNKALILDTRSKADFPKGFIPNSLYIGIDESFAPWVGALITDLKQPIVIIADEGREEETIIRLARVGYDNAVGYLKGGFDAWKTAGNEVSTLDEVDSDEFEKIYNDGDINVLDVRKSSEYEGQHILKAKSLPLDNIYDNFEQIDKDATYYVHCVSGFRSLIASSILKSKGFNNIINIKGGIEGMCTSGIKRSEAIEQNTML